MPGLFFPDKVYGKILKINSVGRKDNCSENHYRILNCSNHKANKYWVSTELLFLKLINHDKSNVGVIPHFSSGQNLSKKVFRKGQYWHNQLRKAFW